jgi:putative nucleotidyltransferase with HDIG domain
MRMNLDVLIEQAYNLEPLPVSAARLAGLVADPDSNLSSITEVISLDPSLTGRVLRAANSARSAARSNITNVNDAVIRLGRGTILSIVVGSAARKQLQRSLPAYGLGENALWKHSVAAAIAAETMGQICRVSVPPEAFAAALLHDIGKLVLARFLDAPTLELIREAESSGHLDPLQAEREILEVNHAELGGLIAQKWGLPESIVQGISYHHRPEESEFAICDVICAANDIAVETGLVNLPTPAWPENHTATFERLGLDAVAKQRISDIVKTRFTQVMDRFGK